MEKDSGAGTGTEESVEFEEAAAGATHANDCPPLKPGIRVARPPECQLRRPTHSRRREPRRDRRDAGQPRRPSSLYDRRAPTIFTEGTISPAAVAILSGELFGRTTGSVEVVEAHFSSGHDPLADVLVISRHHSEDNVERRSRIAIQVGDLEALIAAGEIRFLLGPSALDFNHSCGWRTTNNQPQKTAGGSPPL